MRSILPLLVLGTSAWGAVNQKRGISSDPSNLSGKTFGYLIVGCGTAGSVLANRLSASGNATVACIEAGGTGYDQGQDYENRLLSPAMAYLNGLTGTQYDWQYKTTQQSQLNNRQVNWPRGKILGGSSAINGLYLVQPSQAEHDSWANMIGDSRWAWPQTFTSRRKTENYGAATSASAIHMVQNLTAWGTNGNIHFSFPPDLYADQENAWIPTFAALGIPTGDPVNGHTINAIDSTLAVNPSNYTRSYGYTGYLMPAASQSNLHVLAGYTVTKILFNGTTATGVNFAQYDGAQSYTAYARKEVIVSTGTVGSPQLLMVSGVGPSSTLQNNGIEVISALPGVGHGLREHLSASMAFDVSGQVDVTADKLRNDPSFAAQQLSAWQNGDAADSLYSVSPHMIGMLNLSTIFGGTYDAQQWISDAKSNVQSYASTLGDSTVQAGYIAQANEDLDNLIPNGIGVIEVLQSNMGGYTGVSQGMGITAGLQRPLSRGSITINSASVFDYPTIDPGYLSHSSDLQVLIAAFRFVRNLSQTLPLTNFVNREITPGPNVQSDQDWTTFLQKALATEYSPFGTCSMLPQSQGGVVDANMRVYGTQNLRVVDASIIPLNVAAHGCAPTYAIGETAADIILGNLPPAPISSSNSTSTSSSPLTSSSARAASPATVAASPVGASPAGASPVVVVTRTAAAVTGASRKRRVLRFDEA